MIITIDKAIKELQELDHGIDIIELPDCSNAIRLGIEALKVIKELRIGLYNKLITSPLPGETEE